MLSSAVALVSLQSNFKKSFRSAEKDVEPSITHVKRYLVLHCLVSRSRDELVLFLNRSKMNEMNGARVPTGKHEIAAFPPRRRRHNKLKDGTVNNTQSSKVIQPSA